MSTTAPLLQARNLKVGYGAGSKNPSCISGPLELEIHAGQVICLLGPNGSGKSTLLRTLSGLQPALAGQIEIGDNEWTRRDPSNIHDIQPEKRPHRMHPARLAKMISLVLTDPVRSNNLTAHSLVSLGRYPHSGWLGILNDDDKAIVKNALDATGTAAYADRKMHTLSDGESQKVMLARALAQDTPLMMLDEPTAHLDLPSRIQLMQMLHRLARTTRKGILVSTHELDLALQVADQVWLLQAGGRFDKGVPEDLVLNGIFEAAFDKEGIHFDKSTGSYHINPGQLEEIRLEGEGVSDFWTRRALRRRGFAVVGSAVAKDMPPSSAVAESQTAGSGSVAGKQGPSLAVRIVSENGEPVWVLEGKGEDQIFSSLAGLLEALGDPGG